MTSCALKSAAFRCGLVALMCLVFVLSASVGAKPPEGKGGGKKSGGGGGGNDGGGSGGSTATPMALEYENYNFRNLSRDNSCLGEDDHLLWKAVGTLAPGESFSFTPQYPACNGHPAVISVVANWSGGPLELSSNAPDTDYASWDNGQMGKHIVAPVVNQGAQLCMFPAYNGDGRNYTIILTNTGSQSVSNIVLEGRGENDWPYYYYERCIHADADGDGWNDSFEHTMANLVYPNGYIDGEYQPYVLWGSNYLRGRPATNVADDEIDAYPPDFNDDGVVDQVDREQFLAWFGQGNGLPLAFISPNPGDVEWFHNNTFPWRRYDLDGDGYVGAEDTAILEAVMGEPVPAASDNIAPTARVLEPKGTITRGQYFLIEGYAWDNAALVRVDYQVNGRNICSYTNPIPNFGFTSPFYNCWWEVKSSGDHELTITAYDAAGHVTTSPALIVNAQ